MKTASVQRVVLWVASLTVVSLAIFNLPELLFGQSSTPGQTIQPQVSSIQVVASANLNGMQQLVVLDQSLRSLAVYHVDATGNVQLRSVRSLVWDLRMEEFNGQTPTPSELKRVQP